MNSLNRSPIRAATLVAAAALSIAPRVTLAQPLPRGFSEWYAYDAAGGLLPPDQCWTRVAQGRPPARGGHRRRAHVAHAPLARAGAG
jgi:hypothetical protein